jgi:hypothetical protein
MSQNKSNARPDRSTNVHHRRLLFGSRLKPRDSYPSRTVLDVEIFTLGYPEAIMMTDIDPESSLAVVSNGLIVCSGVVMIFLNEEGDGAVYMSHSTPPPVMAEKAVKAATSAVRIANENGYSVAGVHLIGPDQNKAPMSYPHTGILIPAIADLVDTDMLEHITYDPYNQPTMLIKAGPGHTADRFTTQVIPTIKPA